MAYNRTDFLRLINEGHIEEALALSCAPNQETCVLNSEAMEDCQSDKSPTLLFDLSKSQALNTVLEKLLESAEKKNERAIKSLAHFKSLFTLIIEASKNKNLLSLVDPVLGQTPLINAYSGGRFSLARCLITALAESKHFEWLEKFELFYAKDRTGNTLLHRAIEACDCESIGKILNYDNQKHKLFFQRNKAGLYSLALALKLYHQGPSDLRMSILNQLYFTLPVGDWRSKAAEKKIKIDWGLTSSPLWQYALRYCAKRNPDGTIRGVDMMLVDFICQVIDKGITVLGIKVNNDLVFEYSESYSGTPGELLRPAFEKRALGLGTRTLAQTWVNPVLRQNREFAAQAASSSAANSSVTIRYDSSRARTMGMSLFRPRSALSTLSKTSADKADSSNTSSEGRPHDKL